MRILFLAFEVPYPLDRGGRIKTFHYLRALTRNHEVSLVALARSPDCVERLDQLRSRLTLADVTSIPIDLSRFRKARLALSALWEAEPAIMSLYANAEGKRLVECMVNEGEFDLVYADHLHMAQYVPGGRGLRPGFPHPGPLPGGEGGGRPDARCDVAGSAQCGIDDSAAVCGPAVLGACAVVRPSRAAQDVALRGRDVPAL